MDDIVTYANPALRSSLATPRSSCVLGETGLEGVSLVVVERTEYAVTQYTHPAIDALEKKAIAEGMETATQLGRTTKDKVRHGRGN